jgi:hypothetical protein
MAYQILLPTEPSLAIWHRTAEFFGVIFDMFSGGRGSSRLAFYNPLKC